MIANTERNGRVAAPKSPDKPKDTKPHISISQVRAYSLCSLQWQMSRQHKPEFVSSSLVFGSAFHSAVEALHQARLEGGNLLPEELKTIFGSRFDGEELPIRFGKGEDRQSLIGTAGRMIDAYCAQLTPSQVIAIEEPFELQLDASTPPVVGFIDMIELRKDADGVERAFLVDFKTAARKPSPEDMDTEQLTLYSLAADNLGLSRQLGLPVHLRYDVVTKAKTPEVISIPVNPTVADRIRVLEKAKTCWRGMAGNVCFPSPGWQCANCGYAKRCEAWPKE